MFPVDVVIFVITLFTNTFKSINENVRQTFLKQHELSVYSSMSLSRVAIFYCHHQYNSKPSQNELLKPCVPVCTIAVKF